MRNKSQMNAWLSARKTAAYDKLNDQEKATYREANERPDTLLKQAYRRYKKTVLDSAGNRHDVELSQELSLVPVFIKDPEGHPEDWKWTYPEVGEPAVVSGNLNALKSSVDHVTYSNAKKKNL